MREILESLANKLSSQPVEHVYAEFAVDMTAIMRQLLDKSKGASARDAAANLKAAADIRHTLLKEARAMGLVRVAGGGENGSVTNTWVTWVSQLNNDDIRAQIYKIVQEFQSIDPELVANGMLDADKASLFSGDSIWDDKKE